MKKQKTYTDQFYEIITKLVGKYSKWEIWKDFVKLSAISLANRVQTNKWEEREEEYLSITKKYEKEELNDMAQLLAVTILALKENPEQDFLGSMYHRLNLHQEQKGQFFTPYHVSHLMAELQFDNDSIQKHLSEKGYISVNDPTCGAGALLIAFANVAKKKGLNIQNEVLIVAQDIDAIAAMMCYIQLAILECSATIIIGDSLAKPDFHPDNDVWYTPAYALNQNCF